MKLNPISQSIVDKYSENCLSPLDKVPEGIVFYPGMPGKEELLLDINNKIKKNIEDRITTLSDTSDKEEKKELEERIRVFEETDKKANEKAILQANAKLAAEKVAEMFLKIGTLMGEGKIKVIEQKEFENEFNERTKTLEENTNKLKKLLEGDSSEIYADKKKTPTMSESSEEDKKEKLTGRESSEETDDSSDDILNSVKKLAEEIKEIKIAETAVEKKIANQNTQKELLENKLIGLKEKKTLSQRQTERLNAIPGEINVIKEKVNTIKETEKELTEKLTEKLNELKTIKEQLENKLKEEKGKKEELDEAMGFVDVNEGVEIREKRENVQDSIKKTETYIQKLDEILDSYKSKEEEINEEEETSRGYFSNSTTLKPFKKQIAI